MAEGKIFIVEVKNPKSREPEVEIALWFGNRTVFLFPKEMRGLMKKGMQIASDAVINSILQAEGLAPETEEAPVGLTMPEGDEDRDGPAVSPSMSPVNVMTTPTR